jgi:hypothetical protein
VVFPLSASGDVAPTRTFARAITGGDAPEQLAIDHGEIYVTDAIDRNVAVYPVGAEGNVTPSRAIFGPSVGLSLPSGIVVRGGEIFVADAVNGEIRVFSETANGDTVPRRVIAGDNTGLGGHDVLGPAQLAIFAGEIYVAGGANRVLVFPVNANGNVAPTRSITGAHTNFDGLVGAFVY